jgi:hypothetical protein
MRGRPKDSGMDSIEIPGAKPAPNRWEPAVIQFMPLCDSCNLIMRQQLISDNILSGCIQTNQLFRDRKQTQSLFSYFLQWVAWVYITSLVYWATSHPYWETSKPYWATPHPYWETSHPYWVTLHPYWATSQPYWAMSHLTDQRHTLLRIETSNPYWAKSHP